MALRNRLVSLTLLLVGVTVLWAQGCLAGRDRSPASAAPAKAGVRDDRFGVTGGMSGKDANARLAELGVGWVRIPVNWSQIESQPGRFHWDKVEQALQAQRRSRPERNVMVTVRAIREGERPTPGKRNQVVAATLPRDLEAYHDFLYEFAKRGRGVVDCWQIENEQDSAHWWNGSAQEYLQLLQVAHRAIRAADPGAKIALGGFTSEILTIAALDAKGESREEIARQLGRRGKIEPEQIAAARANVAKVEAILAGAKDLVDVVDVHLYNDYQSIPARVAWVKGRMQASGYDKPIWATEIGGPDILVTPYSEQAQAEELVKRMTLTLASGVEKAFWLGLTEMETQGERFNHLGLVKRSGEVKPAFQAYRAMIRALNGIDYESSIPISGGSGFRFGRGEKVAWVLWAQREARVALETQAPKVRVAQLTGTRTVEATRGVVTLSLTSSPMLVTAASP
jgi:hypothetical protein